MFALIESTPQRATTHGWSGRLLSFGIHAGLIGTAVLASRPVVHLDGPPREIFTVLPGRVEPSRAPATPYPPAPSLPPVPGTFAIPTVPIDPSLLALLSVDPVIGGDPFVTPGAKVLGDSGAPGTPMGLTILEARAVDVLPALLSHPRLAYPEVLRRAGVEGRVVVEAVLDTLGVVEAGSVRVVSGAHALMDEAARDVVAGSRYRPARVASRAVRVRVSVPIVFSMRR